MLIDSHAHLTDDRLVIDVEDIYNNMKKDGLGAIFNVGYDRKSSECAMQLADKYDNFYAIIGTHPHDAKEFNANDREFYFESSKRDKVIAIGEIGLDYYYDLSDRDTQKRVFAEQMELANDVKLPFVVHIRDSYMDSLSILKDNKSLINHGGIIHCYSGSKEILKEILDLGLCVSFGGVITFKNFSKKDTIEYTPIDRIILETDCPYLTPAPYRGKINYPKYVKYVYDEVAKIKKIDNVILEEEVSKNIKRIFYKINGYNSI